MHCAPMQVFGGQKENFWLISSGKLTARVNNPMEKWAFALFTTNSHPPLDLLD